MTIRLLRPWNGYAIGDVVTLDPATEAALVRDFTASSQLGGGVTYTPNVAFGTASTAEEAALSNVANSYVPNASRRTYVADKFFGLGATNAGALGATLHVTRVVPYSWWGVRLHALGICATQQIDCFANFAPSANLATNEWTPTGSWSNFLFSGTAAFTTPALVSGSGSNVIQSRITSDILLAPSVQRNDGGRGFIYMQRGFVTSAGNTELSRANGAGSTTVSIEQSGVALYFQSGTNAVTTPTNFTSPTEWDVAPFMYVELLTGDAPKFLLTAGDSITQGIGGLWPCGNAARLAVDALSNGGNRWAYLNQGFTGQGSDAYFTNGINMLAQHRATAASFTPWSPNDSDRFTLAGVQRGMALAARWVAQCQSAGVTPILVTPAPSNGLTEAQEAFRRQAVQLTKAMCAAGAAVLVDRDSIYTNYASNAGGYLPGLGADSLHPSATGYALEAQAWIAAIQNL